MNESRINGNSVGKFVFDWLWRIISVILVPMMLWLASTIMALDKRVVAIEASRFTATEGGLVWQELAARPDRAELREWIDREFLRLREDMLELRDAMQRLEQLHSDS